MSTALYRRIAGRLGSRRTEDRHHRGARDIDLEVNRQRNHHQGGLPSAGAAASRMRLH